MKKKLGLTLVALLTAFSCIALAAQGDGANNHNGIESQNSTTFLSDSEMKDVVGAKRKKPPRSTPRPTTSCVNTGNVQAYISCVALEAGGS